ncbi:MAG: TonB-dependent receptor, partial [Myxococcales bacterium]|nr:TonB-dependent receptor [Myxococcales bacterium]
DYGLFKTMLGVSAEDGPWQSVLLASRTQIDGYRARSSLEQWNLHTRTALQPDRRIRFAVVSSFVTSPTAEDPGALTEEEAQVDPRAAAALSRRFQTGESLTQLQLGGELEVKPTPHHRFSAIGFVGTRAFDNKIPFTIVSFDRVFYGLLASHAYDRSFGSLTARASFGAEYQFQRDDRLNEDSSDGVPNGNIELDQREDEESFGLFLQAGLDWRSRIELLASIRYDQVSFALMPERGEMLDRSTRSMDRPTSQVGLLFRPLDELEFFGNLSQSFQTPTLTELVTSDGPGLSLELDPETSLQLEGGVRLRHPWFSLEMSAFWIGLEDELVPEENAEGRTVFTNAGESRRIGTELSVRGTPIQGLDVLVVHACSTHGSARVPFEIVPFPGFQPIASLDACTARSTTFGRPSSSSGSTRSRWTTQDRRSPTRRSWESFASGRPRPWPPASSSTSDLAFETCSASTRSTGFGSTPSGTELRAGASTERLRLRRAPRPRPLVLIPPAEGLLRPCQRLTGRQSPSALASSPSSAPMGKTFRGFDAATSTAHETTMTDLNKIEALKRSTLCSDLDDSERDVLANAMNVASFVNGETLVNDGEDRRTLFVLARGEIDVFGNDRGKAMAVYRMRAGECAGTRSFIDGSKRQASLIAHGDADVLTLEPQDFERLLDSHPRVVYRVMRAIFRITHANLMRMNNESALMQDYFLRTGNRH